ncbi:MAG: hypothetical protein DRP56_07100, partial [Planctomycetota bacterium]
LKEGFKMILDNDLIMADSATLASISASGTSIIDASKVLDFGIGGKNAFGTAIGPNVGEGGNVSWNVVCEDEDFAAGGSAAVTMSLVTANDASLSSGAVVLAAVSGIDATPNDGDTIIRMDVPRGATKRYLGMKVLVATAALTTGKVTAWIGQIAETPLAPTDLKK